MLDIHEPAGITLPRVTANRRVFYLPDTDEKVPGLSWWGKD